ncbi:MAG: restriction endonuclease subunit S [Paludibacteraceae bacterium]|nr:restriction endonuclease subunit S [Paludibacteraceae bacterium]
MTEWKEYKLGEIAEILDYKRKPLSSMERSTRKGIYPYYGASGIIDSIDDYIFDGEHILISEDGENLRTRQTPIAFLANGKFWVNNHAHILKADYVHSRLICYYFAQLDLNPYITGAVQPKLSQDSLNRIPLFLPTSINEREKIVSILSSLDDKIDLLHRENATLEQMAETLFRQWFVVEAKEEWEEKELREIVDISIGRTPPRKETKWFSTNPSDVKWLSIKDMGAGDVFLFNTSEYLTKEAVETFSIPIIPKNTVVLSFKMTVGRVGITTEDMLSNEAIAHFKFTNKTPITKEYLYLFLKSFKYDSLGSTSSIVTAINSAMIKQMQIIIPDEVIMKKFEEQTQYIFDKIYSNQKQIQTLIQTRDGLLPRLMSGEIKITEI